MSTLLVPELRRILNGFASRLDILERRVNPRAVPLSTASGFPDDRFSGVSSNTESNIETTEWQITLTATLAGEGVAFSSSGSAPTTLNILEAGDYAIQFNWSAYATAGASTRWDGIVRATFHLAGSPTPTPPSDLDLMGNIYDGHSFSVPATKDAMIAGSIAVVFRAVGGESLSFSVYGLVTGGTGGSISSNGAKVIARRLSVGT